ncbi:hypothetical protein WJX72_007035 [[Myrmecia] bisecta]|uniref:5'-3' exonuclease domain-containing protein n=1 Tax=[Myrmecia] bisecta TaxID=41462 RepID=A0AAW1R7Y0_9CHLO
MAQGCCDCWRLGLCPALSVSASADPGAQDETVQGGRLVLVDAMSFIYRAHHGYGSTRLMSDAGVDTTIIYTFVSAVLALLELQPPPTHIACVFDAPGKTFSSEDGQEPERARAMNLGPGWSRNEIYPGYKGQRTPRPPEIGENEIYPGYKGQRPPRPLEIGESLPYIRQMLRLMGVHEVTVNGVEADDVIGTLATRAIHAGMLVAIASPDKDFFQLLQPGLQMLRPAKRNVMAPLSTVAGNLVPYTADAFIAEYGIQPHQWADVLALSGDASDNIPGVNGIGAKGALNLVKQFDDVESILEHASQVKRKQSREALLSERGQAEARLAKRLVTIQTEMDLPPLRKPLQDLALLPPSPEQVRALQEGFAELDFRYPTERMMAVWERMKADLVAETHEVMSI